MKRAVTLFTAGLLALGSLPALAANEKNRGHGQGPGWGYQSEAEEVLLAAVITAAEIAIIRQFIGEYGAGPFGPPPGLPPGIAKNLARGKPLPPGIAKRYLPYALLVRLPPRPGHTWLVVDNDILLVVAATAVIVDILADAF